MGTEWDRGKFESTLDLIEIYLADLQAIDEFIEAVKPNAEAAKDGANGMTQILVSLSVGKNFTFEMNLVGAYADDNGEKGSGRNSSPWSHVGDGLELAAEAEKKYKELLTQCYADGKRYASDLVEYVRSSAKDQIQPIAQTFQDAADKVRVDFDNLSTFASQDLLDLTNSVGDWEGDSADTFFDYTYGHIAPAAETQKYLAAALCYGLTESCSIVKVTQEAMMSLATALPEALKKQLQARAEDWQAPPPPSTAEVLGIVSASIGVLAAIPTGGTALGVMALVGAGAGMASSVASLAGSNETTISSSKATDLGSDFFSMMTDTLYWNRQSWDRLTSMISGVASSASASGTELAPRMPDSGRMTPGEWHHESVNY